MHLLVKRRRTYIVGISFENIRIADRGEHMEIFDASFGALEPYVYLNSHLNFDVESAS